MGCIAIMYSRGESPTYHRHLVKFFTAISALSISTLSFATALIAPQSVSANPNWIFINKSENGALYFGRNARQHGDTAFIEMKSEEDPAGANGDNNAWTQAFNCSEKKYMEGNKWLEIEEGLVNYEWFQFACKT